MRRGKQYSLILMMGLALAVGCSNEKKDSGMGLFQRMFGRPSTPDNVSGAERTVEELRSDPSLIQIFDEYGQERFVEKDVWQHDILPGTLKDSWDDPDQLYGTIIGAVNDGFLEDVLDATRHLQASDPHPMRGSCLLGIVLMKLGRLDEAELVLNTYTEKHGREGVILTNLAKVYAERGEDQRSEEQLWRALEVDPNQDNAVEWFAAIHRERSGESGYFEALEKIAALEGSWRPQLWLARESLAKSDFDGALRQYEMVFALLEAPSADVLQQVSGDLGNAGRLADIIALVGEHYRVEEHGLMVGNNLIKAHVDMGHMEKARVILESLYAQKRPDWQEHLAYWDDQISDLSEAFGPITEETPPKMTSLTLSWPVWSHKLEAHERLLPVKSEGCLSVAFMPCSSTPAEKADTMLRQKTDMMGTLGRAIPLFVAEQVHMLTTSKGIALIPVIADEGSFVVSGSPWPDETVVSLAESAHCAYVVNSHLDSSAAVWTLRMNLLAVPSGEVRETFSSQFNPMALKNEVLLLADSVCETIARKYGAKRCGSPIRYRIPREENVPFYLDSLARTLALSVATADDAYVGVLYGEHAIFDSLLGLSLRDTESDVAQLVFIGALAKNRAYGSKIFLEYEIKARKLVREHSLDGVAGVVINDTITALYGD